MPVTRNALIRYKTIDQCLRNRRRRWTLEDLIDKVSEALYDYEGIDKGISRRTLQADIRVMRSDKLGYNAPIIIIDKKYYTYEDAEYSITNIPLTDSDLSRMSEAVAVLKQFKGFSHFRELDEVVQKLEGHVYASAHNHKVVIDFEKNEHLKGLEHLSLIYEAITREQVLEVEYQSFKAKEPQTFFFHAWWLKEFKNRWFAIGVKNNGQDLYTLALDRMLSLKMAARERYRHNEQGVTPDDYYKDVIGVSVSENVRPVKVHILVTPPHAPYVLTKPLHPSQRLLEQTTAGTVIEICVQHNFELEKEILGFGEAMIVLKPERLRKCIRRRLEQGRDNYLSTEEKNRVATLGEVPDILQ